MIATGSFSLSVQEISMNANRLILAALTLAASQAAMGQAPTPTSPSPATIPSHDATASGASGGLNSGNGSADLGGPASSSAGAVHEQHIPPGSPGALGTGAASPGSRATGSTGLSTEGTLDSADRWGAGASSASATGSSAGSEMHALSARGKTREEVKTEYDAARRAGEIPRAEGDYDVAAPPRPPGD
jgi:hypothetical protein